MATITMEPPGPQPRRPGRSGLDAYGALERAVNLAVDSVSPADWAAIAMAMHQLRAVAIQQKGKWVIRSNH